MGSRISTIERAFELAREDKSTTEIKRLLQSEGYWDAGAQLHGRAITASLKRARLAARLERGA
jgi:hypothetical protein